MSLLIGTRPRIRGIFTPPPSSPAAVVSGVKVIIEDPSGDQTTYTSPHASIVELDDNDWVFEWPTIPTELGGYTVFMRSTGGIETSAKVAFVLAGAGLVYA